MASHPLPGKILAPLADRPLLDLLVARVSTSRVDEWWLATSSDPSDDVTEAWGFELGLRVSRGGASDALARLLAIGAETQAEWFVRVGAHQPFVDGGLIDDLIDARDSSLEAKASDLFQHRPAQPIDPAESDDGAAATTAPIPSPTLPMGYCAQLIRRAAIDRARAEIPDAHTHRHHLTSWLAANTLAFDVPTPPEWPDRPRWRWTLDTYEDLAMARSAFRLFGSEPSSIDYPAMVARLDAHPEISAMNLHVRERALGEG